MDSISSLIPGLPEKRAPAQTGYRGVVEGRVLRDVASSQDGMHFVLRTFDGETHEWGPAPWPDRGEQYTEPDGNLVTRWLLPLAGDRVWVAFPGDGTDNPVVLMWWPVGRGYEETRV